MKRLFVAVLAAAFAFAPLAGLAQDKPADKSASSAADKAADKATTQKKRKSGGC